MPIKNFFSYFVRFLSKEDMQLLDHILHIRMSTPADVHDKEHANRAYWDHVSAFWDNTPLPIRPSADDLACYGSFLAQKEKKDRILILGSTPELRDLASSIPDASIYVADFSYKMLIEMLRYTRNADYLKEKWVKDNWLALAFPEHFFDVILGDIVLHQVTPDQESAFLKKMHSLLRTDGCFISRFQFLDEKIREKSIASTVDDVLNRALTQGQMITLLKLYLPLRDADPVARTLNRMHTSRTFEKFLKQYPARQHFLEKISHAISHPALMHRNWSPPDEQELNKILSSYFRTIDVHISHDHPDAACYPLYVLQPT